MKYQVVRIDEDINFGCEERSADEPVMAVVVLQDENGNESRIRQEDQMLYDRNIEEGDTVILNENGELRKTLSGDCYMSDVPRPLKQEMPRYREIEDHLLSVIYEKYLGSDLTAEEQRMMKQIDNDLLWYDLTNLLEEPQEGDAPKLHITLDYAVRPFDAVEKEYLELFEQYQYRETGDERR